MERDNIEKERRDLKRSIKRNLERKKKGKISADIMLVKDSWKEKEKLRGEIRRRYLDNHKDREKMTDTEVEHVLNSLENLYFFLLNEKTPANDFIKGIAQNNLAKTLLFADDINIKYLRIYESFLIDISDFDLPGLTKAHWKRYNEICIRNIEKTGGKESLISLFGQNYKKLRKKPIVQRQENAR